MDIRARIRRDVMGQKLREFVRGAGTIGASPEETSAALVDMLATIYAVRLAGAPTDREKRRAKAAYLRVVAAAIEQLPTEQMDALIEVALRAKGY